ncbi:MAG: AbrB/MazE/SpoVT family DNA-binding domain-containing protein [Candidatus Baltobacteraceae bacterium]
MKTTLHRIGNSQGVILPKPILAQIGLTNGEMEMTVESDAIVLRKLRKEPRAGWAQKSKAVGSAGEDALVWPEWSNEADDSLTW